MRRLLIALISVMSVLLLAGTVGFVYTFSKIELPDREPPLLQTTLMCPANVTSDCNSKNSIAQLSGGVNRIPVEWDQIPPVVVNAVLGAEDRSFFSHGGVDPSGIVRALWADARNLGVAQGGSTITQQYVKNVYLTQERTITRKIKEVVMAVKLERELSKEEILTRYLNLVYFGRGAYGIEAAARAYFGVHMADLSVAQAAYLAGLIRSPESADAQLPANDPRRDEQRATAEGRRHSVLQAMLEMRTIDATEFAAADGNDWSDVVPRSMHDSYGDVAHPDWGTEYFVDYVKRWMVDKGGFTDAQIYGGGLRVYTTLDMDAQGAAAYAVRSTLDQPFDPAAALVSIDDTGAVRAMIGGFDFNGTGPYSKVNLAVGADGGGSGRQAGSAFKTFTLAEAMVQGMPLSKTYDAPAKIVIPKADNGKDWNVANYEDAGLGKLDVVAATQKSSNTAYAQIVMDVGPNNVSALAKQMGVTAPLPAVPSITLGSPDVSVMDMASAYSTLADGGDHVAPVVVTKVTDAKGNVLYENRPSRTKVLDPMIVAKVDFVLNQVIEDGTGTGAKFGESVAGKTGTTENYRDAWFAGFTCKLTTAVWVGYPDGTFMRNVHGIRVTGGSFPATIWRKYMSAATAGLESCPYPRPPELDTTTSAPAPPAPPPAPTRPPVEVTTTTATEPPPPPTTVKPKESLQVTTTTVTPSTTTTVAPTTTTTTTVLKAN